MWVALTTWTEPDLLALASRDNGDEIASSYQSVHATTNQILVQLAKVMRRLRELRNTSVRGML